MVKIKFETSDFTQIMFETTFKKILLLPFFIIKDNMFLDFLNNN
jgi:hypothetical protein